jgi:hypothetical protein
MKQCCGSVTCWYGSGSGRPEKIRIRIYNTAMEVRQHTEEQTVEGKQQWVVRRRNELNSREIEYREADC